MKKIAWFSFGLLSTLVGLYPFIYFFIDRRFGLLMNKSTALLENIFWNIGFYGHIIPGGLALLIGWLQFSEKLRLKNIGLHKSIGKAYVSLVMVSSICGLYIGFYATGGYISAIGFLLLGLIWLGTTVMAYRAIKEKRIVFHQWMMIYSYAACFAAVTLRIWLPLLIFITGDFMDAYRIVAWASWIPNLLVAFFIVQSMKKAEFS